MTNFGDYYLPREVVENISGYLCSQLDLENPSNVSNQTKRLVTNPLIRKNSRPLIALSNVNQFLNSLFRDRINHLFSIHKENLGKFDNVKERYEKKYKTGINLLRSAIISKDMAGVEQLLLGGANVNAKDAQLGTPLHYAVKHGTQELVALLLRHPEINKTIINDKGLLPIDYTNDFRTKALLQRDEEFRSEKPLRKS